MPIGKQQLKQIFVDQAGLMNEDEFEKIVISAGENRKPLDQVLMERGFVAPHHFISLLSDFFKVPATDLRINEIDPTLLDLIPEKYAGSHLLIPFAKDNNVLKVAMVDPSDLEVVKSLEQVTKLKVQPYVATEHAVKRALVLYRGTLEQTLKQVLEQVHSDAKKLSNQNDTDQEVPSIVTLIDAIIESAVLTESSDIHIEPFENEIIIRFRIDGLLKTVAIIPPVLQKSLVSRLKILAALKLDETRLPQDGRISAKVQSEEVNLRVSTVPSMWGEKIVMRVLRQEAQMFDLGGVGFLEPDLEIIRKYLKSPFGMILICGPTGSGKTSTLYAFLQEIGMERIDVVNISTIEDPIEYTIPRVTQIQIHPEIDLTFASGLRSLLRQDPDIIMVGEIRDKETADIAVRAALVGRLLLSSLHTNDAIGAIPRLIDMGIESYLVSSTLALVIAQRLVRKLCSHCRQSYKPTPEEIEILKKAYDLEVSIKSLIGLGLVSEQSTPETLRFYKSVGCDKCDHSGYLGRVPVFEVLAVSDALKNMISAGENSVKLKEQAVADGMKTMFTDGLAKVILGVTDLPELKRVSV